MTRIALRPPKMQRTADGQGVDAAIDFTDSCLVDELQEEGFSVDGGDAQFGVSKQDYVSCATNSKNSHLASNLGVPLRLERAPSLGVNSSFH